LALYEIDTKRTILSRDRYGVKPLHYIQHNNKIHFSSEIKTLLCDLSIKREVNSNVIMDFLINGLVDFTDETFFKNIYRIPSGSYVIIDTDYSLKIKSFYDVSFSDDIKKELSEDDIIKFRKKFDESISLRLRADVPVGSCLSGGLDSSSIVCHVNKLLKSQNLDLNQETFSACYKNFKLDEKKYIDKVVEYTDVTANYIYPTVEMFNADFDHLIYTQEEPFSTTSIYASYCVMREARRKNIPVLLDGQGADELLCGYRKSRIYYIKRLIRNKVYLKAGKELLLSLTQIKTSQSFKGELSKLRMILFKKDKASADRKYIANGFEKSPLRYHYNNENHFLYNDLTKISLPSLLRFADRNSMAFSVEDRLPFLDYKFVDYAASLPLSYKLKNGYSKYIMRKALIMPAVIRNRKDKIGFATPDSWIKENSEIYYNIFANPQFRAKNYIDNKKIIHNWNDIINGKENIVLFRYVCLEKWMQIYDVS
jgi:asparagine synthase (glutamine-hydrolysing)